MARILVVDDSAAEVEATGKMLSGGGHEVLEALDGKSAIEKAKAEKPDVIVMDVVMPGMNGFQATRSLSRDPDTKNIPVIVLSSKNQETDRVWAMRQGAKEYCIKPVSANDLLSKISAVLAE